MEESTLTIAFFMLVVFGILIRVVLPLALIVIGALHTKKNKRSGKPLLCVGILILIISVAYYIYSK